VNPHLNLLVLNCGSSSLKFQLLQSDSKSPSDSCVMASGFINSIASKSEVTFTSTNGPSLQQTTTVKDHGEAAKQVIKWLISSKVLLKEDLYAVAHRVVHGGDLIGPVLLNEKTLEKISSLSQLAPLHNEPSLKAIYSSKEELGANLPMIAVFDTDFHRTLPEKSSRYAIPVEIADRHHVRRYGFHGIAHRFMAEHYAKLNSSPLEKTKLITAQLGGGCSLAAIQSGISVDTSMGLTPLEGLMMPTRSGDVDPSLEGYLAQSQNSSLSDIENLLNTRSGLLGVSGLSEDPRELLRAEKRGNSRASLAIEMFCYRVKKYIGSYLAVLGGAQALVFGGGIGENSPDIRSRICKGMEWSGIMLDEELNLDNSKDERKINSNKSKIDVCVIPVHEEEIIGHDASKLLLKMSV
jgi:acetate kinase